MIYIDRNLMLASKKVILKFLKGVNNSKELLIVDWVVKFYSVHLVGVECDRVQESVVISLSNLGYEGNA